MVADTLKFYQGRVAGWKGEQGGEALSSDAAQSLAAVCRTLHAITEVRDSADPSTMNLTWRTIAAIVSR